MYVDRRGGLRPNTTIKVSLSYIQNFYEGWSLLRIDNSSRHVDSPRETGNRILDISTWIPGTIESAKSVVVHISRNWCRWLGCRIRGRNPLIDGDAYVRTFPCSPNARVAKQCSSDGGKRVNSWLFLHQKSDEWRSHDVVTLYQPLVIKIWLSRLYSFSIVTLT